MSGMLGDYFRQLAPEPTANELVAAWSALFREFAAQAKLYGVWATFEARDREGATLTVRPKRPWGGIEFSFGAGVGFAAVALDDDSRTPVKDHALRTLIDGLEYDRALGRLIGPRLGFDPQGVELRRSSVEVLAAYTLRACRKR